MKKIILFTTLAACGCLLGVEKQYNNVPELPPEIEYQIMEQLVNTARTRTEALQNLHNYAVSKKMSAYALQLSKKYLQSLLDQKFELYKLAFSDYHDPVINNRVLDILKREKRKDKYEAYYKRFHMAISDIKDTSKEITSLSQYLYMLEDAVDDKKTVLSMILLRFINQFKGNLANYDLRDINSHFGRIARHAIDNIRNNTENSDYFQFFEALIKIARRILPQKYLMYTKSIFITDHTQDDLKWQDYTIFEYAQKAGTPEVVDYLRRLGFDVDQKNKSSSRGFCQIL
ncbi:hypothetical protein Noda2021_01360 [Candidatus Dependentiae bacterium Noda2021]|nr:hypothetical protein Noda2021_01360 [Candidatus Dependentiae bacterium Noda2021]